ncbi:hypothetical protein [Propionibacterium sp.]|uniref:hypothetical protein n=1 Tax=Propionibacterium sp. TaxID=1977903 RepID=UPI0039E93930
MHGSAHGRRAESRVYALREADVKPLAKLNASYRLPVAWEHPHPLSLSRHPANSSSQPSAGRTALVTGVSRRRGIRHAVARRLASLGADLFIHHYRPHDLRQPWGGDDLAAVRAGVAEAMRPDAKSADLSLDLAGVTSTVAAELLEPGIVLLSGTDRGSAPGRRRARRSTRR